MILTVYLVGVGLQPRHIPRWCLCAGSVALGHRSTATQRKMIISGDMGTMRADSPTLRISKAKLTPTPQRYGSTLQRLTLAIAVDGERTAGLGTLPPSSHISGSLNKMQLEFNSHFFSLVFGVTGIRNFNFPPL